MDVHNSLQINVMKLLNTSLSIALTASIAAGQWSDDPASNLAVSDAAADQVQPMIAPTADGGCYISWFDSIANGFDVRLQRLDAAGNELWPHGGVLVIDRGFSSTQAYGLDVDAAGNALVTARDDGGVEVRVAPAFNYSGDDRVDQLRVHPVGRHLQVLSPLAIGLLSALRL